MSIKPIETIYKGYRFRSRLEARWAVFFDALGIEWQYEVEGFDLSGYDEVDAYGYKVVDYKLEGGTWYLPDFYLPGQGAWVEIKPTVDYGDAIAKPEIFARAQEKDVFVFMGEPYEGKVTYLWLTLTRYGLFSNYPLFKSADFTDEAFFNFMHPHYPVGSYSNPPNEKNENACYVFDRVGGNPEVLGEYHVALVNAYAKAMQARFGKSGRG